MPTLVPAVTAVTGEPTFSQATESSDPCSCTLNAETVPVVETAMVSVPVGVPKPRTGPVVLAEAADSRVATGMLGLHQAGQDKGNGSRVAGGGFAGERRRMGAAMS